MIPRIENAISQIQFVSYPSFTYLMSNWKEEFYQAYSVMVSKKWGSVKDLPWQGVKRQTWGEFRREYAMERGYRIIGDVDGIEALRQAIFHRIFTERYAYEIYDGSYGTELEQYIGNSFEFLATTIQNTLKDSLLQDDRITGVTVTDIRKVDADGAWVQFDAHSNMGVFQVGLPISYGGTNNG